MNETGLISNGEIIVCKDVVSGLYFYRYKISGLQFGYWSSFQEALDHYHKNQLTQLNDPTQPNLSNVIYVDFKHKKRIA